MCGIIGALAFGEFDDKKMEKARQEAMIYFGSELLQLTVTRGKDATGVATLFADCDYTGLKMGISSPEFVARFGGTEADYEGYLKIWRNKRTPAKFFMGHCRKPSTSHGAGAEDNVNNHPIKIQDTVIIHNGTLTNHEVIFDKLGGARDGKVDSEAIPRLLNKIINNGAEPFSTAGLVELCKRLSGSYACLGFNGNNPYQVVAFCDDKPIVFALVRPLKLLLIASDKEFLHKVMLNYTMQARLYSLGAGANATPLRKGDVLVEAAADLSTFLFDLRTDITTETKIEDLCETAKVPRIDKIWKPGTKPVAAALPANSFQGNHSHHQHHAATSAVGAPTDPAKKTPRTEVNTATPIHGGASANNMIGMAFDRRTNQFAAVPPTEKKSREALGSVIVDLEEEEAYDAHTNTVVVAGKKKGQQEGKASSRQPGAVPLSITDEFVDCLLADAARVVNIDVKVPASQNSPTTVDQGGIIAVHRNGKTTSGAGSESTTSAVVVLDKEKHPDVVEAADTAAKSLPSFKSINDVAIAIDVHEPGILKAMKLFQFANRLKRVFYRLGFYAGWVACLKDQKAAQPVSRVIIERQRKRLERAEETIRVMKATVGTLALAVPDKDLNSRIEAAVSQSLSTGAPLAANAIGRVFTEGDLRKVRALGLMKEVIAGKEGR